MSAATLAAVAGERLSPILVKELRQGLRATIFTGAFLLIHVLMIASVLLSLSDPSPRRTSPIDGGGFLFWGTVWLWSVIVLPARAYAELRRELRDRTLELTFLTRLTAWRIVAGKWLSVFLQTLLVISAVLPYAVLRYFVGSVDLVMDLIGLAGILVTAGMATALMLVAAACQSWLLNIALALGALVLMPSGSGMLLYFLSRPMRTVIATGSALGGLFASMLPAGMVTLFLVEFAASRIAPPAENHAARKRLLALGALSVAAVTMAVAGPYGAPMLGAATLLALFVAMDALCERPVGVGSLYLPFVRRGLLGRAVGMFFYPGWPSGVVFSALVLVALTGLWTLAGGFPGRASAYPLLVLPPFLLLPVAMTLVLAPRTERRWAWYGGLQAAGLFVAILWLVVASWVRRTPGVECLCPAVSAIAVLWRTVGLTCLWSNTLTLGVTLALLIARGRPAWRALREAERRAAARTTPGAG